MFCDFAALDAELAFLSLPAVSEEVKAKLEAYAKLLVETNEKMNLTAITDPIGVARLHFADSLTLFKHLTPKAGWKCLDVGSGAGFPMIPLLIAAEGFSGTMMDSTEKKVRFLNEVCRSLSLNGKAISARAEVAGKDPAMREQFDLVTARAVARLDKLAELCLPFVAVGGQFVALKGADGEIEAKEAKAGIKKLGGGDIQVIPFTLSSGEARNLVVITKEKPTPKAYPRAYKQIAAKPL